MADRMEALAKRAIAILRAQPNPRPEVVALVRDFEHYEAGIDMECPAYYMNDNHTFLRLPGGADEALSVTMDNFDKGNTFGMLCTHRFRDMKPCHAHSHDERDKFKREAAKWLCEFERRTARANPPHQQGTSEK